MSTRLFVGNLAYSTTEEQIREAFSRGGRTVESIRIALDRETQRPRGFAFVDMASDPDADAAIQELHNQPLSGRTIFVEKAQERAPGGARPPSSRPPSSRPPYNRPGGDNRPFSERNGSPPQNRPRPFSPGNSASPGNGPRRPSPFAMARMEPAKEGGRRHKVKPKKEKEKRNPGRPEQRERGKWRWDGQEDY